MEQISFNEMLQALSTALEAKGNSIKPTVPAFFNRQTEYIIFLSATDGQTRAQVVRAKAPTFQESWKQAVKRLRKTMLLNKMKPVWLKADLVTDIETKPFTDVMQEVGKSGNNDFRRGIAFDKSFKHAFLEQEINANQFFPKQDGELFVKLRHINDYAKHVRNLSFQIKPEKLTDIYTFDTLSVSHDGFQTHEQETGMLHNGTRKIDRLDAATLQGVIHGASLFLMNQLTERGDFHYGYYPAFNHDIHTYNILHHASAIYALGKVYQVTQDENLPAAMEHALTYVLENHIMEQSIDGKACAFVMEKTEDDETTLGANAYTILAIEKFISLTQSKEYESILEKLANGILHCQKADGSFNHVLYVDGTVKKAFKTVSYDTEAVFALMRVYERDPQDIWLNAAKKSADYFVENDYWNHGNPWLSYATMALFKHAPNSHYAALNIRNTERILDFCLTHENAAPELLELLMASYELIQYMKQNDLCLDVLDTIDTKKLGKTIQARARHQLHSFFWPEMAMYFHTPLNIAVGFYEREDAFRTSINEIANQLTGLSNFYQAMQDTATRKTLNILPHDHQQSWIEADMLMAAKRYENMNQPEASIKYFETMMQPKRHYMDMTYVTYAKMLRKVGVTDQAEAVIQKAHNIQPNNERILSERFDLYRQIGQLKDTKETAKQLVQIEPEKAKYHFMLGKAYADMKQGEKAEEAYKTGLIYWHDIPFEDLLWKIKSGFTEHPDEVTSTYKFLGGRNNLGAIVHEFEDKVYFTKIAELAHQTNRERVFYKEVMQDYPDLKTIAPAYIDVQVMDNIQYLTTEKVDTVKTTKDLEDAFAVSGHITAVKYDHIKEQYPNPTYPFILKNRGATVVEYFTEIHEKAHNEQLFEKLRTFAEANDYPDVALNIVEHLKKLIMENHLYDHLSQEEHFSLLHGDFTKSNMTANRADESLQIIDWGAFTIGPRIMDAALFLSNLNTSYATVKKKYVYPESGENYLSDIERVFFLYGFIVLHFVKLMDDGVDYDKNVVKFIEPAMKDMIKSIRHFNKTMQEV